ncbi:asparagine synthetase B [candidate division KSB1 bacterium]|nr:asparagine synthetase B [candidate division KSB1 bacterium]
MKHLLTRILLLISITFSYGEVHSQYIVVPMDQSQTDHLKAYGAAFWILQDGGNIDWLLNYRGGSFMMQHSEKIENEMRVRGVLFQVIREADVIAIQNTIEQNNMESVKLEKAPKIAIYSPPNKQPWDDAVTMALTYAEIPYTVLWDEEVLTGQLEEYDWLHLHHEDFTGQYGKFYSNYGGTQWYIESQLLSETIARKLGFSKVSEEKKSVARWIRDYVAQGGFMFAMCSSCDSFDIALASGDVDIVSTVYDGDPADPDSQEKLDYSKSFAFMNFTLNMNPMEYEYSNIDYPPSTNAAWIQNQATDYFKLFEFSAKYDPVPTMLTQNHVSLIKGFMGQTTGFRRDLIKKSVIVMGEMENTPLVKYIHGNYGKGMFTFYGGHDPEDYTHYINDPPTQLSLHRNSPGYRLILNNILFPAAKKKNRKTDSQNDREHP